MPDNRFEDVTNVEQNLLDEVIKEGFPSLINARFLFFFDNKKRKSKGKYVIGRIKKLNEEQRAMTIDNNGIEYNYAIFLDKYVWQNLDDKDKTRMIRRLLCHCELDLEANDPYKIQDPEISDWYSEIEYNKDDPRWMERVGLIAENLYDNDTEE